MKDRHLDIEEEYYSSQKKEFRKERKILQKKDRSKYKKTDQLPPPPKKKIDPSLSKGRVIRISGEHIFVFANKKVIPCFLKGVFKKEKTKQKKLIAVGDIVYFRPLKKEGSIEYIEPRYSFLSRADNLSRRKEHLIAVNIDQVFIVTSVIHPPLKPALIDRYIIAVKKGGMQPLLLLNKIDLLDHPPEGEDPTFLLQQKELYDEVLRIYPKIGIPTFSISAESEIGMDQVHTHMLKKTSVFSGQSGVGKTSILNAILDMERKVGEVTQKTRKGSHTTATAELIPLQGDSFCIDTPGIKSFGLFQFSSKETSQYFPDFYPYDQECQYPNCTHIHEPNCGVLTALKEEKISSLRYHSYTLLLEEKPKQEWD